MYANNRLGDRPKALFRAAGGNIYLFAHPYLIGQLRSSAQGIPDFSTSNSQVDISGSLRLNDNFFNAQPAQDNALQEVMVDGSTLTITNHLMNGRATLQVAPGTGLVGDGDLTAIAPFIMSAKDIVGGVLTRRRFTSQGVLNRLYYGVTFANFPHDVDVGNAIPIYPMVMLYSGWVEGLNADGDIAQRALWAVGNTSGYKAVYTAFANAPGVGNLLQTGTVDNESAPTNDSSLGTSRPITPAGPDTSQDGIALNGAGNTTGQVLGPQASA